MSRMYFILGCGFSICSGVCGGGGCGAGAERTDRPHRDLSLFKNSPLFHSRRHGKAAEPPRPPAVHSSLSTLGQTPLATPSAFAWLEVTSAHSIPRFSGAGAKRQTTVSLPHGMICRSVKGFGLLGTQCGRPRWFSQRNPSLASRSAGLELSRRTQRRRRAWLKSSVA